MLNQRLDIGLILQSVGVGVWEFDPQTNLINLDDTCRALFGLTNDSQLPYDQAVQHIHPDDSVRVGQVFQTVQKPGSGGVYDETYRLRGIDDGRLRWVRFQGKASFSDSGELEQFAGIAQEVAPPQPSPHDVVEPFRLLADQVPAIIFMADPAANVTFWNRYWLLYTDQLLPQTLGRAWDALIHPDDFDQLLSGYLTATEARQSYTLEARVRGKNGLYRYFQFTGAPYHQADGLLVGTIGMGIDIHDRKMAEQALESSEIFVRNLFDNSPVANLVVAGPEMVVRAVNEGMLSMLGRNKDIVGQPFMEVMPELKATPLMERLRRVVATGKPYHQPEERIELIRYGQPYTGYYHYIYTPLAEDSGQVGGVVVTAIEVTDQVLSRQKAEESETKLRSVIEAAPIAIGLLMGPDHVLENPNQAFIDILGKGPTIDGKPLGEAMPELVSENQPFLQILDTVYTTGQPFHTYDSPVYIQQHGVMNLGYYNFSYTPMVNAEGQVYAILDTAVEVTGVVKARQELEASETRFRQAVEQAPVAILLLKGQDLLIETANSAMLTLMDRSADSIGKPLETVMPELSGQSVLTICRQVYESGEPYVGWHQPAQVNRNGQLESAYFNVSYTPFYENQRIMGVLQVVTEVTEQVLAHRQLQLSEQRYRALSDTLEQLVQQRTEELASSNEELAATNEELASNNEEYAAINEELEESNGLLFRSNENLLRFAYVASHDLQEPLRKVQSFGDLLKEQYGEQLGNGVSYLERMQAAASRMSTLIKDLLSFSRISIQQETTEPVSLNTVVQTILTDLELVIEETGAIVTVGQLPTLDGDHLQFEQLFQNLLSNALKFRQPGVTPEIQINSRQVTASELPAGVKPARTARVYYRIDVRDNGVGFDEKYLDRIFLVFQRLHGKNQYSGTGIGLAICEKVVANHGGAITANSQPGQGATFSVYLPQRQKPFHLSVP